MTADKAKAILDNMYGDWRTEEEREALSVAITLMGEIELYIKPCGHVLACEPCDYYDRKNDYTCDFSDLCASCKHNPEI